MRTLVIMTGLLIAMFSPVFASYNSDEAKEIVKLETQIAPTTTKIKALTDSLVTIKHSNTIPLAEKEKYNSQVEESIFGLVSIIAPEIKQINTIKQPLEKYRMYWLFGALVVVIGGLLFSNSEAQKKPEGWGAMQYPQLVLGMLAIFTYVGVEVAIGSNLGELLKLKDFGHLQSSEIAPYISMYWEAL